VAGLGEGKIPHRLLRDLLGSLAPRGPEVIVGAKVGEDAFAVRTRGQVLVGSTDPITFAGERPGYFAVHVNANDVATMGARPRWCMATFMAPPGTGRRLIRRIFGELNRACDSIGVTLVGGHTEITSAVTRPTVVAAMLGTVSRRRLVRPERVKAGDRVLLTKRLALEGTAILAAARRPDADRILGRRRAARARRLLFSPGISVVDDALCAGDTAPVHAMHDPTEGGLAWGLTELSMVTGLGIRVDSERVPFYEETLALCKELGLNPLGLIASGSLLIVASTRSARRIGAALSRRGIECTDIGEIAGRRPVLVEDGRARPLPRFRSDEISRALS
jgi:hydrogenase maturation factor